MHKYLLLFTEVRQLSSYSHKMTRFVFFVTIFVLFYKVSHSVKTDYFWREYTGEVPVDAIVGGKDINGKNIYIGQVYVKNQGLIVVQIFPGIREVQAPIKGIKKVDKFIKILCGPQEKVYWMMSTSANLHLALINKHAVIGGHEDNLGYLNIGRISHEGEVKIVVHIFPGIRDLHAPIKEIEKVDKVIIKILCGPQEKVYWMPSTSANLHLA